MKIMGKGSDPAAARKMIADERNTPKRFHLVVSRRPFFGAAFDRVREVGTCISCGRLTSIEPGCVKRCSMCGTGPPPVYAARPTTQGRQHLQGFLLRHRRKHGRKTVWRMAYRRWLSTLAFDHPAQQIVFQDYVDVVTDAERRLSASRNRSWRFFPIGTSVPLSMPCILVSNVDYSRYSPRSSVPRGNTGRLAALEKF